MVRGKRFFANHVYSILRRKRERDERLSSRPKNQLEIGPLSIRYVDKTLINSD